MKFLLLFLLSVSGFAHASLAELFGPSAGSIAIGSQAQGQSAANNYHAPALQGYARSTQFSFDSFYIDTAFTKINNVETKNASTSVNETESGNVKINPVPTTMFALHFSTPLFSPTGPKFNVSLFAPAERLIEASTGDTYQPSYVMYGNRFTRPTMIFGAAQAFNEWSFSLGVHTGFQTNGESSFVTRTTNGSNSIGKMNFNSKPSIGGVVSVAKKTYNHTTYLTFQQEMKSRFKNRATSETEIASSAAFQFDLAITSLLYYDPMIVRLGDQIQFESSRLFFSVEYQQWESFQAATMNIQNLGGSIQGSRDYEKLKLKNIFIPKIGFEQKLGEYWTAKMGYFYRQSPLYTNNLKNAGNSIDVDKHVGSVGLARLIKIYDKDLMLDLAYQGHFLRSQKIVKTANLEDDQTPGNKIGSPGYRVGGMIHVVSLGLSWMY